jgi:hypothetical protein
MVDYKNAEKKCGKDLGVIKGKKVRVKTQYVDIDTGITSEEKMSIFLSVDVMYFTGLIILMTKS